MASSKILILGANGQIGTVLASALRNRWGDDQVVCSDIKPSVQPVGIHEVIDVLDKEAILAIIRKYEIRQVYHLAAILSAKGEQDPISTWNINMQGLLNVLELAVECKLEKIFYPSTIAIYGPTTPKIMTPQHSVFIPTTVYGISKHSGELWCNYFNKRYGLDVRSLRYPGVVGWQSDPGGGTTDYAVEIFHEALKKGVYSCFLESDTRLPMIYMEDCIRATLELMEAPSESIHVRTSYNLAGMSFTPEELANEIRKHLPDFQIRYHPDFRQAIAKSWNESIDDTEARRDWGWNPQYNLERMTSDMIFQLRKKYNHSNIE